MRWGVSMPPEMFGGLGDGGLGLFVLLSFWFTGGSLLILFYALAHTLGTILHMSATIYFTSCGRMWSL